MFVSNPKSRPQVVDTRATTGRVHFCVDRATPRGRLNTTPLHLSGDRAPVPGKPATGLQGRGEGLCEGAVGRSGPGVLGSAAARRLNQECLSRAGRAPRSGGGKGN